MINKQDKDDTFGASSLLSPPTIRPQHDTCVSNRLPSRRGLAISTLVVEDEDGTGTTAINNVSSPLASFSRSIIRRVAICMLVIFGGWVENFFDPANEVSVSKESEKRSTNSSSFVASAINMTFMLPTDPDYIHQLKVHPRIRVEYLRNKTDIKLRGSQGNCRNAADVLGWIMDEVNKENGIMMVAYGNLIHIFREREFLRKESGKYIDDDFDLLASLGTVSFIGTLEPEMFKLFGWTARAFVDVGGYVLFMQIMASCGHTGHTLKVQSDEPGIEVYPLGHTIPEGGRPFVKDLWQATTFSESMVFPPHHISFNSAATNRTLDLQVPNKPMELLTCLYGDWTVPSSKHARGMKRCVLSDDN